MTTAVGTPAVIKDVARNTLAALTAFQAWHAGVTPRTLEESLARIYFDDIPLPAAGAAEHTAAEMAALRPYAVIFFPRFGGVKWHADAGPRHIRPDGQLLIYLEAGIPTSLLPEAGHVEDTGAIIRDFENQIGLLINSSEAGDKTFASQRAIAGYLNWKNIEYQGPGRCHSDNVSSEGDHQYGLLIIDW